MKKIILKAFILLLAVSPFIIGVLVLNTTDQKSQSYDEKIYVALEAEGRVVVVDALSRKVVKFINLSELQDKTFVRYSAHNIQVTPDGSKVLVSANVMRGGMSNGEDLNEDLSDGLKDKVFIIDPLTDTIIGSIPIGIDLHLAHVVSNSSGTLAYVTAQEKSKVYILDLQKEKVMSEMQLNQEGQPHGLRISADNNKLFIALIGARSMAEVNLKTTNIKYYPFPGKAVQTAVTPDGTYVFASVYDTKQIAWVNLLNNDQGLIDLPNEAHGAVQLYPTPDSKYILVADQGYYFDQPTSNKVYKIAVDGKTIEKTVVVGRAPHGVVVDKKGEYAYITNLLEKTISIIDLALDKEISKIIVGEMPNGISVWNRQNGGTP